MRKWSAVYENDPHREVIVDKGESDAGMLKRFDAAARAANIDGREVIGMWIIDHATEQAYVIKYYGRVSDEIRKRFNAWKEKFPRL